jgi:tRNA dimethylallyltransferase
MESRFTGKLPLVVIVGPTASGKTGAAIWLAKKFKGEIICADSRTVYKGMDIGTAKPSSKEQAQVPHWGLDLVEPGEYFTVADFKSYATKKISEIRARGNRPFLVGGTGLYVDAILFDYEFGISVNQAFRKRLESMSIEELYIYCIKNNINLPENKQNKRYIIRAIEQRGINTSRRSAPIDNTIIVGIATDKINLRHRIEERAEQLFHDGVVEEATKLGEMYGWQNEAMTGNIYPLVRSYLRGELTYEEMEKKSVILDWRLAKRQLTWLKRNPYIHWLQLKEVETCIANALAGPMET